MRQTFWNPNFHPIALKNLKSLVVSLAQHSTCISECGTPSLACFSTQWVWVMSMLTFQTNRRKFKAPLNPTYDGMDIKDLDRSEWVWTVPKLGNFETKSLNIQNQFLTQFWSEKNWIILFGFDWKKVRQQFLCFEAYK